MTVCLVWLFSGFYKSMNLKYVIIFNVMSLHVFFKIYCFFKNLDKWNLVVGKMVWVDILTVDGVIFIGGGGYQNNQH